MNVEPVLTANQQLVSAALTEAEVPQSAYAILERLQGKGIKAPLQVYRALEKPINFGLVHRLEILNAFVVCDHHVTTPSICAGW
jgi:Fur family zinc uptake transcriptional regulator